MFTIPDWFLPVVADFFTEGATLMVCRGKELVFASNHGQLNEDLQELVYKHNASCYSVGKNHYFRFYKDELEYFGPWIHESKQTETFLQAQPFPHIVLEPFLDPSFAEAISQSFHVDPHKWHVYWNPIEKKLTFDNLENMPWPIQKWFELMQSDFMVGRFGRLMNRSNLEADPYLHGAGMHAHPAGGKLDVHLDYEIHSKTGKIRRLNLIQYVSRNWEESWGGATEFWQNGQKANQVNVQWNRAVIFRTTHDSWHGLPTPLRCPPNEIRKSLAIYYVSPQDPEEDLVGRRKASFVPVSTVDEGVSALYELRRTRRIEDEDLKEHLSPSEYQALAQEKKGTLRALANQNIQD